MRIDFKSTAKSLLLISIFLWFGCSKDTIDPVPSDRKIEIGTFSDLTGITIGTSGGMVLVNGGTLDGMSIEVPRGGLPKSTEFSVSMAEIKSHNYGSDFNPITPLIRINNGGNYADSVMTITIPCVVPKGHFAMGFYYDEETGELEGIPVLAINDNNIVLATRHFSNKQLSNVAGDLTVRGQVWADILVSSMEMSKLFNETQESGFRPGVDDWEFPNYGSYISPGGHCAGQSLTAMWYYNARKLRLKEAPLYDRFSTLPNPIWQDNRNGYRFASVVQNKYDLNGKIEFSKVFSKSNTSKISRDSLHYLGFAYSIRLTKKPQYVAINNNVGGHAMIVYRTNLNVLVVADPNFPDEYAHLISLSNGKFLPYESKANANEPSVFYPKISYFANSAFISSQAIGEQYDKMLNGNIGNGENPTENFPYAQLVYYNGKDWIELSDTLTTDLDTVIIAGQCSKCKYTWFPDLTLTYWLKNNGNDRVWSKDGYLKIPLDPGLNVLPITINGYYAENKYSYLDFKTLIVNKEPSKLSIVPNPILGSQDHELSITAEFKGQIPAQVKFIWDFGDGRPEIIKYSDNNVKYTYLTFGEFKINVSMIDNLTGKNLGSATALAEISNPPVAFNTNYRLSDALGFMDDKYFFGFEVDFNISGTAEATNGNIIKKVENEFSHVTIFVTKADSIKVNFFCSLSFVPPLQKTDNWDPKVNITFSGVPRLSLEIGANPEISLANGVNVYEGSCWDGNIDVVGYMDYVVTLYDANTGQYKTTNGTHKWKYLGGIEFDKY